MRETKTIPFARPWITNEDREAVLRVLEQDILTHGPECRAFEEEFSLVVAPGTRCLSVSSCMAALHLSYLGLGIGPGDEVLVPAQTHTATVHAVELAGARPVFVDCDPLTGNLDPVLAEAAVTHRTRAIGLVHFVGIPCPMNEIMDIARRHHLRVIEDAALAIGARFGESQVGTIGDAGCFSFYPAKHLTTGEGGMFVTRDQELAEKILKLRAFGVDRSHRERKVPGVYDVVELGLNYRMSELHAALGRTQLTRLEEILRRRGDNFRTLRTLLGDIDAVTVIDGRDEDVLSSHYCLSAVLSPELRPQRDRIIGTLSAEGIGTSVYYPHPVPLLSYYRARYGHEIGDYPNAESISYGSIALPIGPHLDEADVVRIADVLHTALKEVT